MEKFGKIYRISAEKALKSRLDESISVFIVKYTGLNAAKLGELRQNLKGVGARLFVSKNSLAKRVVSSIGNESLSDFINGPIGFIFIKDDPVAPSKILNTFIKENEAFAIKGGFLQDRLLSKADIQSLANLPTRDRLIAITVAGIKSPITNFVLLLNQLLTRFVIVVKAISDKKKS
jgi:large subunit ribosomal protein L10